MPIIRVTAEQFLEILTNPLKETNEEVKIWEHIEKYGFLFNEYTLTIRGKYFNKDIDMVYKVKIDGVEENQKIYIREVVIGKDGKREIQEFVTTIDEYLEGLQESIKWEFENLHQKKKKNEIFDADHMLAPMYFMRYCVDKAMNRESIEMPITQKRYKPINERSKSRKKTEYKLFEIIRKYEKHMNHNRHSMTCEHWEVKGHFRHYKNGKVVYIKPFSKGKNKDAKIENRVYTM